MFLYPLHGQPSFMYIEEWMDFIQYFVCNFVDVIDISLSLFQDVLIVFLILYGIVYLKNSTLSIVFQYLEGAFFLKS